MYMCTVYISLLQSKPACNYNIGMSTDDIMSTVDIDDIMQTLVVEDTIFVQDWCQLDAHLVGGTGNTQGKKQLTKLTT